MFESLVKNINEAGGSVRAYDACSREARARIADEPQNAAALLLISYATQRFVDSYDDQPLTVKEAAEELDEITQIVSVLDAAFSGESEKAKLDALNQVATRLGAS
ncbi:MAG: hypothetical protein JJ864_07075 [Rhizobiaceae bacterium]|nr:hypothetical protein [Rhizobiaceae bacterium]